MISREYLENFGIHELRLRGRELGVKSPASKRKEELINEIIAIENGQKSAYRTNMGRKPKKTGVFNEELRLITQNHTLSNITYADYEVKKLSDDFTFNSQDIPHIELPARFLGIAREISKRIIITNYLEGDYKYIVMPENSSIVAGDLVEGSITQENGFIEVKDYNVISLSRMDTNSPKIELVKYKNNEQVFDYIQKEYGNKIVFEVEAEGVSKIAYSKQQVLYFCTPECADVALSFNMMLDCQNMVKRLVDKGDSFTVYLTDINYMFAMLSAYFSVTFGEANQYVNAGQIFKVILSLVNSSKNGKVVIFEKENTKHNPYLDIIIERYIENN